nr:reverse transcriptase domain-containing protein [Tanacetum cinerariifolium]
EVIVNGDAPASIASVSGGVEATIPLKTTVEKIARRNELKAKSTLLLAIPDEHLLKFYGIKDAKTLWETIKTRFGGNKQSNKMEKTIPKEQYENFIASRSEGLDKTYDSLPPVWNTHTLIMQNKFDLDTLSMYDLYNNLKVYEAKIKGQSSSSPNPQNVAFVSSDNISSTNEVVNTAHDVFAACSQGHTFASTYVDDVMFSFFANQTNSPQLDNEDLEQIDTDDLEEMDLKWHYQDDEGPTDFALMAFSSLGSSSSDTELEESLKEKDDLKLRLEKFKTSSKNLANLLNSQLSSKDKTSLGYDSLLNERDLSNKSDVFESAYDSSVNESGKDNNQANDRYKIGEGYHAVPPPYTDQGIFESGCSRHMMGKKCFLTDYQEIDGGFVAFGGSPKGGKISRKGTIRTGKLDFEDVYFVKELKFNLFSVSQICDKKNRVLFTETECLVLSPDFKLPDKNQVLLKVPRQNNMYSFDLKNVVPIGGLTCLFAKATIDESNLWFRRLGYISFKTMNKLVRGNLVKCLQRLLKITILVLLVRKESSTKPPSLKDKNASEVPDKGDDDVSKRSVIDDKDKTDSMGAMADTNNLELLTVVIPIPITKVHKDHPKEQVRDLNLATQTRRMLNFSEENAMVSYINKKRRTNHKDYHKCLFACFLSQQEPKKVIQALADPSWIEAMQEKLLKFKLQKVWTLCMRTRSKSYPINSNATIPGRSNRRRVPNIVELEIRTIEEFVPMADRTMKELLQTLRKGSFFQNQTLTSGTLPSNIVPNPKGEIKAVTTRSGLAYEGPLIPTNSPLEKPTIPYPSRLNDQKLHEKATNQMEKFFQIFHDLHFDISFANALLLMPKFASTIKSLLTNKDKLFELAKVPLNENCSAMLLKKLLKKLGDPGKFLIPCDFPGIDISLPELTPTRMTLELADRSITRPKGVAEDVFVKVGKFHFPTDFVVVDFKADPRVPLILGRSFLRTGRALIDVYGKEITLRVNDESITFNLNQTMRYSSTYDDNSVNRVDVIDIACEEFVQDVLDFQYNPKSSNPTLVSNPLISESESCKKPIIKSSSPTLTPFGESDFFLKEIEDFLNDESIPTGIDNSFYDQEGDILYLEWLLNEDPFQLPLMDLKQAEETMAKSSIEEPHEIELKELPSHLGYAFLEDTDKLPVIIAKDLKDVEKEALIKVLKSHKRVIAWKISDIKGYFQIPIDPQDQEKTTFTCPFETFAYRRVPFGLCNAPDTFQRCMIAIFHDMIEKTMEVFMDDFSVFGDSFSSCLTNLDSMLKRCEDTNLVLNWEKCHFMCREWIVLGHKFSKSGIKVDREKVDVIAKLPHPTTVKGVRSFLGHAGFYQRFIQYFSKIARPMTHLLENETPFVFFKECVDAFNTLKKKLTEASILVVPDWNLPFELMCDASNFAIGAVLLLQEFDITILDKKGYENLAADHLSRLENPHKDVLENKDINENFSLETLGSLSSDSTPWAIISDHGTHFYNDQFTRVMIKYEVTHRLATAYHPQTSGQVEVSNRRLKRILERTVGENHASWSNKLDDALWAFRCTPYKLVYEKSCHLPIELEHRAYWALKQVNFDLKTAGDHQKLQLNELNDQAYENSVIYKERIKKLHDSKIKNRIFNVGDQVLLFNSRLKIFSGKLKTRWSGPFTISQVFPYGTVESSQPNGPNFKVNGHRVKHYFGGDIPSKVVSDLNVPHGQINVRIESSYVTRLPKTKRFSVYKVEKALYGLHQAPRAWYETLSTYLLENGFRRGTIDKTLFIKKDRDDILLVQVYVNDIIFGSTKNSLCDEFEQMMHKRFQMSSMVKLTFFLGLQVKQKDDGIFISQDKYVVDILKKFGFTTIKTASTLIEPNKTLIKDAEAEDVDVHLYRSMIRSLMYLIASRPDIMFSVCACARFQVTPKTSHLHDVKRIFRYLKSQPKLGLWYPRNSPFDLEAFFDSDYTGASLDRKSTIGVNDVKQIHAKVDGKTVVILESSVRSDLHFNNEDVPPIVKGEGSGQPSEPQPPSSTTPPEQDLVAVSQPQKTQTPRRTKKGQDTKIPQSSGPPKKVGDEAVYTREDDRVVRAATTAASLETEQESGQYGNQDGLMDFVPPIPYDSPLLGGHTPGSNEGRPNINELMNLCTQLSNRVLALEQFKTAQDLVIKRETKVFDYTTTAEKDVNAAEPVSTAGDAVNAASVIPDVNEMKTMADTLMAITRTRPRTTLVMIHDVKEEPRRATLPLTVQSQDKGKGKMVEPEPISKNPIKAQIQRDAKIAQRLFEEEQAQFEIEQMIAREKAT